MTRRSKPLLAEVPKPADGPTAEVLGNRAWDYGSLEEAFPDVSPGLKPFGDKVLVQIKTPLARTKSGFILPHETIETEQWNTQVAKVIALGPVAFKNRDTLQPFPEGEWVKPGMFVRCPLYGGDRWIVPVPNTSDTALFAIFRDMDLVGEIEGDPLAMVAYLR
jgi:co-chaperonin GroES (HSP10)